MTEPKKAGRPKVSDGKTVKFHFNLSEAQRIKVRRLGGAKWVRQQIDAAANASWKN